MFSPRSRTVIFVSVASSAILLVLLALVIVYLTRAHRVYLSSSSSNKNTEPMQIRLDAPVFRTGELKSEEIQLRYIPNFLTGEECDHIVQLSQGHFVHSPVLEGYNFNAHTSHRTSSTYYIPEAKDALIKGIEARVSDLVNKPVSCIEALQVVRYEKGQEFKEHWDWFYPDYSKKIKNQRIYTFFVYLNDLPEGAGGETAFPNLKLKFTPAKGSALFWVDCDEQENCSRASLHQGKPPLADGIVKYGLNIWVNLRPVRS